MNAPERLPVPPGTASTTERGIPPTRAAGTSHFHESAIAQVAGAVSYVDDIPEVRGTLHAAPVCSPVAHGILRKIDTRAALALPPLSGPLTADRAALAASWIELVRARLTAEAVRGELDSYIIVTASRIH